MAEILWYIRTVEVLTVLVGAVLVTLAYKAYRRSEVKAMIGSAVGFGMIALASLLEGILFEVFGVALEGAHAIRSSMTLAGFLVLLYSIKRTA